MPWKEEKQSRRVRVRRLPGDWLHRSQVSRIFVANMLRARADLIDDSYLLTTDADIWPIYGAIYRLPPGHDVVALNSDCCGAFSHRGVEYRMLPMANVGMRVRTWRRLTRRYTRTP